MTSKSWAVKHRPKLLKHIYGNEDVIADVKQKIGSKSLPQTILITGNPGAGKTTLARIIASKYTEEGDTSAVNEINAADHRGIDDVRKIIASLEYKPLRSKYKIIIADEVHKFTNDAASAFLKGTEEPPEHVFIILATNEPHKLPETLRQRCYNINLKTLSAKDMFKLLRYVADKEGVFQPAEKYEKTLQQIAQIYQGRTRDALNHLHKVSKRSGEITVEDHVRIIKEASGVEFVEIPRFLNYLYSNEKQKAFSVLEKVTDYNGFSAILLGLNTQLLQVSTGQTPSGNNYGFKILTKGLKDVSPKVVNAFQYRLLEFRKALMQNYGVDEKAMVMYHCFELTEIPLK